MLSKAVLALCITGSLAFCPYGYTSASNGFCYKIAGTASFRDANAQCALDGAILASIHSQFMNSFIRGLANEYSTWIGLSSPYANGQTGKWTYLDGSPVDYMHSNGPNNTITCGISPTCYVYLSSSNGFWTASGDNDRNRATCQIAEAVDQAPCFDYFPMLDENNRTMCYSAHFDPLPHDEAEAKCQAECGHLAVIKSQQMNDALLRGTVRTDQKFIIGLVNTAGYVFQWSDGSYLSALDYTNFGLIDSNIGKCVALSGWPSSNVDPGQWSPVDCTQPAKYFCTRGPGACNKNAIEDTK